MRVAGVVSGQRRPHKYKSSGAEVLVAEHLLKRKFDVDAPNTPDNVAPDSRHS
jgi:putative transposase